MKQISLWAKHHRPVAIILIIFIKSLLVLIAFMSARALLELNIHIPLLAYIIILPALFIVVLLYPRRNSSRISKRQFYIKQKCCDFAIGLCSFALIVTMVNTGFILPQVTSAYASSSAAREPTAEEILASLQYRDKSTLTKQEKRILKQELKKQVKVYVKAKLSGKKKEGEKALLIILTIIGALTLLYVLAALCCSLSCSGAEGAAVIVGIIGTVAIIWGTIAIIRRILHGPRLKKEIVPNPRSSI